MPAFMHVAGVVCLIAMFGAAAWTIYATIRPNLHKMEAALGWQPRSPRRLGRPHATAHSTPLRRVEAAAEPTLQVEA